jgi:hypothetical protein
MGARSLAGLEGYFTGISLHRVIQHSSVIYPDLWSCIGPEVLREPNTVPRIYKSPAITAGRLQDSTSTAFYKGGTNCRKTSAGNAYWDQAKMMRLLTVYNIGQWACCDCPSPCDRIPGPLFVQIAVNNGIAYRKLYYLIIGGIRHARGGPRPISCSFVRTKSPYVTNGT